jgi:sec-independent protein translocase protein TatB
MLDLSPAKLLVILVVGVIVLGPDKLPKLARQLGAAWGDLRRLRARVEEEVRGTFPDLPSTYQVAQAVRSPLALLDRLADAHEAEEAASRSSSATDAVDERVDASPSRDGPGDGVADQPAHPEAGSAVDATPLVTDPVAGQPGPFEDEAGRSEGTSGRVGPPATELQRPSESVPGRVGPPAREPASAWVLGLALDGDLPDVPDDPSMN